MSQPYFLVLPLLWSFGFAVGGVMLKRALDQGAGPLRIAFLNNLFLGIGFLPGWFLLPEAPGFEVLKWPLLASAVFFTGQVSTFVAMRAGDVTVLAPVMGVKVVFVAVLTAVLGAGPMPWPMWVAAFLSTAAVFLLGMSNWSDRKRIGRTAATAVFVAALYGWCDLIVQVHAPELGAVAFSAVMMSTVAVGSFLLLPFFRQPLRAIPPGARPWAIWGSVISAAQSGGMAYTLGHFGQATAVNIVYSTRGLWSILLVWLAGSWFSNREAMVGRGVMTRRLAGALLLLVAVGLIFI